MKKEADSDSAGCKQADACTDLFKRAEANVAGKEPLVARWNLRVEEIFPVGSDFEEGLVQLVVGVGGAGTSASASASESPSRAAPAVPLGDEPVVGEYEYGCCPLFGDGERRARWCDTLSYFLLDGRKVVPMKRRREDEDGDGDGNRNGGGDEVDRKLDPLTMTKGLDENEKRWIGELRELVDAFHAESGPW